jgi:hypothetical protein
MKTIELSADFQVWLQVPWFEETVRRAVKKSGWTGTPMQTNLRRTFDRWKNEVEKIMLSQCKTIVTWSWQSTKTMPQDAIFDDILFQLVKHQCRIFVAESESYDEW